MNIVYIYIYIDYEKSNFPKNVEIKAQNVESKGIIVTPQIMHVMCILQLQVLASECSLHQRRARHLKHQQSGSSFPSNLLTRESRPEKDPNRMWAVSSKSSTSITPGCHIHHFPFAGCTSPKLIIWKQPWIAWIINHNHLHLAPCTHHFSM